MQTSRRGFLGGLLAVVSAPAIVRVGSLMQLPAPQQIIVPELFLPETAVEYAVRNNLLTINQIMRDAVRLFKNSNAFIQNLDAQYEQEFAADNARIGTQLRITVPKGFILTRESAMKLVGAT